MNSSGEFRKNFSKFLKEFEVVSRKFLRIKKCKCDSSLCDIASVNARQYRQLHIAYCILHIACCMLRWCKIPITLMSAFLSSFSSLWSFSGMSLGKIFYVHFYLPLLSLPFGKPLYRSVWKFSQCPLKVDPSSTS